MNILCILLKAPDSSSGEFENLAARSPRCVCVFELFCGGNVFKTAQNSQKEGFLCVFASFSETDEPKAGWLIKAVRSDPSFRGRKPFLSEPFGWLQTSAWT